MTFRFLPDVALADIAFEAEADTVDGLFESCALAITDIMVDPKTLQPSVGREFAISSPDLDRLLYDFLTELIVVKDVDSLIFGTFDVRVDPAAVSLTASAKGEAIDRERHHLRNDVKAVTMHLFGIKKEEKKWRTTVVLDI
jgi:SHS2 domain-containing protein